MISENDRGIKKPIAQPGINCQIGFRLMQMNYPIRELSTPSMSAVPHVVLDLAAAQAEVFEHAIVRCRKLSYVATDAQFIGNRGD